MTKNYNKLAVLALAALSTLLSCSPVSLVKVDTDDVSSELSDSEKWGRVMTDTLTDLPAFDALDVSGLADVVFVQNERTSVVVEGNEKMLEKYIYEVKNGTLVVEPSKKIKVSVKSHPHIRVYVSAPSVKSIELGGAGNMELKGDVRLAADLDLQLSGAGNVRAGVLKCHKLSIGVSGAGYIDASQIDCDGADIDLSGAGNVNIDSLKSSNDVAADLHGAGNMDVDVACRNLSVDLSGAAKADVKANCDYIDASLSGVGSIKLSGRTKRIKRSVSDMGKIRTGDLVVGD